MDAFRDFLIVNAGSFIAAAGAAMAVFMSGIGSSKGCALVGKAAAGLVVEEPQKFGQALILQLLPGTQGLYGFIVGFLIAWKIRDPLTVTQGLYLFLAALPVAFSGYRSAIYQGEVATAGLQILAKNPGETTKGIILAAIVETYAILGFVGSIILAVVVFPNIH